MDYQAPRSAPLRVIKLGGSLLDWPTWPEAFRAWHRHQRPLRSLLVVGGGAWADLVRDCDASFSLGEVACHWLCLRLMSTTARLAHLLLPEAGLLQDWAALQELAPPCHVSIVDVLPLIEAHEQRPSGSGLPHSWAVTSDSIAAWLAVALGARELVLLKSRLPHNDATRQSAASSEYVDRHFPVAAQSLGLVRCVNLRDPQVGEVALPR